MKGDSKAIKKAILKKSTGVTVTIGAFVLTIPHEEAFGKTMNAPKLAAARHHEAANSPEPTTTVTPPLTHVARGNQQNTRNQNSNYQRKTSGDKAQHTQKFIKVPKPTLEWQRAEAKPKPKLNRRNSIQCFYCKKKGHIERYCWNKIKCFSCNEVGHKCARCPYNHPFLTHKLNPKPISRQNTNPDMDPIYGRPAIAEAFTSPRHTLSRENDYLCRVGLIVFIRGFPSPDMPRLVAQTLAIAHGGRTADYDIVEATIAPYLLTCRNAQLRDAVVQRGVYTNPQAQIQFAVHEWRPRFGMGYDPPTYQAWVKVVGLSLQAWTPSEVTAFLQKFGHPLHIMPLGRSAGHFKDITALVGVKDPSRIPLAYTYREGDYATQVDIYILNWRLWEESQFPPPGDDEPRRSRQDQTHNPGNSPNLERNSFSSSSSNGAPSEPTIDLSAWSPKSRSATVPP